MCVLVFAYAHLHTNSLCVFVCVCVFVCSSRQSSHGECEGKVMWSKLQEWVWYAENREPQLHSDTSFSWAHRSIVRQMKQQTCGCQSPEALAWDWCARNLNWRSLLLRPEGWKEHSQSREITDDMDCNFGSPGYSLALRWRQIRAFVFQVIPGFRYTENLLSSDLTLFCYLPQSVAFRKGFFYK